MASRSVLRVPKLLQQTLGCGRQGLLSQLSSSCNVTQVTNPDVTHDESAQSLRKDPADADNLMDIGIRKIFNEEHDIFRASSRKFWQEEVAPNINKYEAQGHVDRELWEKAGEQGMLGVSINADHGGLGGTIIHSAITWEEQGYINDYGCGFQLHSEIVMPYISKYGTPEQVEKFIPQMTAGQLIGSLGMTEPQAGSDLQGIRTAAKRDGDDWILNGSKVFITNGWMSDVCIVVAITNPDAKSTAHGISLFLVEEGMPGFKKGNILKKMGTKSQDTAELFFDDVRLPTSSILGGEACLNKGFYCLMEELPLERLEIAVLSLATAEWMFEETRAYVRQRKAFKKTIADLQTVQHKLAEMKTSICVARAFVDDCIVAADKRELSSEMASMAKYWCSDLTNKVAYDCVQLHGGWGYMWEYPIARAYVNARVQTIYGGTNEIMKELIARRIVRDDWILNGSKVFITNGWLADVVIVVALTNPEAKSPAHGISLFLLEEGMPGFKKGSKLKKMGMKAQDTAEIFFDDVRLPTSSILGGEAGMNRGFYQLMQELPLERLEIADLGLASAEWMFEETWTYVRERKAFKKTIADLQTVQHKLAEIKTSLCVARAFVDDCIVAQANHRLSPDVASMAKYWCTDLQNKVAYDCVQLHGGWGYMWEYGISRAYVNARVQTIYGGTNEIMKELIARKIVKG